MRKTLRPHKPAPTKRAPDAGVSAHIPSGVYVRPHADNVNYWMSPAK